MLPRVIDVACSAKPDMKQREKVVPRCCVREHTRFRAGFGALVGAEGRLRRGSTQEKSSADNSERSATSVSTSRLLKRIPCVGSR